MDSDEQPLVPARVLVAIEQIANGETASKEDLDEVLKY